MIPGRPTLTPAEQQAAEIRDHIKGKKTAERDRQRLDRYVYPFVRGVAAVDFTLDHAEAIMKALPKKRVKTAATGEALTRRMLTKHLTKIGDSTGIIIDRPILSLNGYRLVESNDRLHQAMLAISRRELDKTGLGEVFRACSTVDLDD